ncbi:MAG: hypothetical protein JHC95_06370 [Solirubrobacteraceae bacterium]|nr:hypothetical protein [Solirubrobacteraceae bacterium]
MPDPVSIAVTDHAVERFRQRVAARTGGLDPRPEIVSRVARAWAAGRVGDEAPDGGKGPRGSVYVADLVDRDVVFVCRHDRPRGELIVITLWERERIGDARVPRRYTDALRRRQGKDG